VNVPRSAVVVLGVEELQLADATVDPGRPRSSERRATFALFVDTRLGELYRLASVILGDPAESEDAVHDALERAWRSWPRLQNPDRFDAWVSKILVNECRDRLRRRRRRPVTDISESLAATLPGPDDLRVTIDRDEVGRAFATLGPDHQIAIVLRFYADLTVDQIAARVGAPTGTVKSRLHHALAAMNAELVRGAAAEAAR
jgi:RNA polymerase sigma factor (sigma-70 family)